jgi:hypothetical protein
MSAITGARMVRGLAALMLTTVLASPLAAQTITVVNMIPQAHSAEKKQNSEPSITVHRVDPRILASSATTVDPTFCVDDRAALFVSKDAGDNWDFACVIPRTESGFPTDMTTRFAADGNALYVSLLRIETANAYLTGYERPAGATLAQWMELLTDPSSAASTVHVLTRLIDADQPQLETSPSMLLGGLPFPARRAIGIASYENSVETCPARGIFATSRDPWVGPATKDFCLTPRGFARVLSIRTAIHPDGTGYAILYRYAYDNYVDVVVLRHDNGITDVFQSLKDLPVGAPTTDAESELESFCSKRDGKAGYRLVRCALYPTPYSSVFGQESRRWSQLSIAVDPTKSSKVYVAWADSVDGSSSHLTLHFASSADRGNTWTVSPLAIDNATNPALAVAKDGAIGLLYQQLVTTAAGKRWQTWFSLAEPEGSPHLFKLADASAASPVLCSGMEMYQGDYLELHSHGKDFYGVFSASNDRSDATFFPGAIFHRLYDVAGKPVDLAGNAVAVSMDPYFVKVIR